MTGISVQIVKSLTYQVYEFRKAAGRLQKITPFCHKMRHIKIRDSFYGNPTGNKKEAKNTLTEYHKTRFD